MRFVSGRRAPRALPISRLLATALALLLAAIGSGAGVASANQAKLSPLTVSHATDWRIHIVRGSNINLVSTASRVPVQIRNDYDTDIRVLIWSRPSNLRITMPKAIAFTAPANTTSNATIPVEAIANGEVRLNVWLTSFSGVQIGRPTVLNMSVERDIEGSIVIGFFVVVGALGYIGGRRMILRKRQGAQ